MGRNKFRSSGGTPAKAKSSSSSKGKSDELEGVEFGIGKSADAAAYENTKTAIIRFVSVRSWHGAADAAI